ncbi:hypothetical protein NQ318_016684 [Aromia moschata]|uniref:Tuberin N-terminal domain-containing protein n=1 Tax=Aromia moschata TaxID=1265417 RepID=A0AAV8Y415_9CUCU|nr:hypothetical protein NQ318_016684 [Aromia moschata]
MSSKDKSLQDKLRDFLKRNKGHAGNIPGRSEFVLSEDLLRDLSYGSPITVRIKILKDLSDKVTLSKLENNALEKLWNSVKDLFGKEHTTETRHLAFTFLQCLLKGQSDKMKIMRAQFFRFIKEHDHPEDVGQRLELLNTLTTNGKYILYFEEEVGPFFTKLAA